MKVLVYKTNVTSEASVKKLKPFLSDLLIGSKWNFDLEDCDNILRVEIKECISQKIVSLLKGKGFLCEEFEK